MKVKSDYVTNSSSISFCIYGVFLEKNQFSETIIKKSYECEKKLNPKYVPESMTYEEFKEEEFSSECLETLSSNEGLCLSVINDQYGGGYYLGRSLTDMKLDQTMRQFQNEIDSVLEKMGINQGASIHEDGWYDG